MTTYILLRKNKESAPLTIEDLKTLDLVPDDRIWVEGQSVYWLSPGEITELKPLLQGKSREPLPQDTPIIPVEIKTEMINKVGQNEQNNYVPEVENPVVQKEFSKEVEVVTEMNNSTASVNEHWKKYLPRETKEEKVVVETIFAKEQTSENYFNPTLQREYNKKRNTVPPGTKKIAVYAGILILGVLAVVLIKNNGGQKNKLAKQSLPTTTANETIKTDTGGVNSVPVGSSGDPVIKTEPGTTNTAVENEDPAIEKIIPSISPAKGKTNPASDSTATVPAAELKNDRKEREENVKKGSGSPAEDISSQVSVKANDYIVASFGGIRNLELTVSNDSKYMLDKVTVDLQYLKPRDEFLRSELIVFSAIPPGGSQKIAVKKSNRGVKVECKIIRIVTKESGF